MNIVEQSKILAEYLGWKYIPSNDLQGFPKAGWYVPLTCHTSLKGATKIGDGYYNYVCRSHKDLRFYNSMDWLIKILDKLTKEKSNYYFITKIDGTIIDINIGEGIYKGFKSQGEGIIKNTFNACVEAVEYINRRKI